MTHSNGSSATEAVAAENDVAMCHAAMHRAAAQPFNVARTGSGVSDVSGGSGVTEVADADEIYAAMREAGLFTCPHCPMAFSSEDVRSAHTREKHPLATSFVCEVCHDRFEFENDTITKLALLRHMSIHAAAMAAKLPYT